MSVKQYTHSSTAVHADILKNDDTGSFMYKLAGLLAQIYATFSKISQNDQLAIVKLEADYKKHSYEIADLLHSRGNASLGMAIVSTAVFATSLAFANTNDQKFIQLMSEKAPILASLFDNARDGKMKTREAQMQIEYTKLQEKTNKSQNEGNIKSEFARALEAQMQLHTSLARGN